MTQLAPESAGAPARLLDEIEEKRMELTNDQLIAEAVEINHAGVKEKTYERYRDHLEHFAQYLASVHERDFYTCRSKHVRLFMAHLERPGGVNPHRSRLTCEWCRVRGYPDGRSGSGWSASYRKSYLAAIKFLYRHFMREEDLPDHNPASMESAPKVVHRRAYTPSREDVRKLLETPGTPRARLLAYWTFYAPSRRQTFVDALWTDLDLDTGEWSLIGKGEKADVFALHPALIRELRIYRRWQLSEAARNPAIRDALSDPDTAYVLLTRNGKKMHGETVRKILNWHAIKAGVGVVSTDNKFDSPGGQKSLVGAHAMRRAWASTALNDEELPIDVVSEVLLHRDITTTRRHYAPTKPERAKAALVSMRI